MPYALRKRCKYFNPFETWHLGKLSIRGLCHCCAKTRKANGSSKGGSNGTGENKKRMGTKNGRCLQQQTNFHTDAQRAQLLLRRDCKYLISKINLLPEARAVLAQIESGPDYRSNSTRSVDSGTTTCKNVLEWMDSHEKSLPKEYRKPTSDAQRAEYRLRNKFKQLKRKTIHLPVVRALLDKIECCSSKERELNVCLTVLTWLDAHDNALPLERKVFVNNDQRDECMLARRWRGFKRRKTCTSEALTLYDKIEMHTLQSTVPSHCKGEAD